MITGTEGVIGVIGGCEKLVVGLGLESIKPSGVSMAGLFKELSVSKTVWIESSEGLWDELCEKIEKLGLNTGQGEKARSEKKMTECCRWRLEGYETRERERGKAMERSKLAAR